jgi:hypothetical protein
MDLCQSRVLPFVSLSFLYGLGSGGVVWLFQVLELFARAGRKTVMDMMLADAAARGHPGARPGSV